MVSESFMVGRERERKSGLKGIVLIESSTLKLRAYFQVPTLRHVFVVPIM